MHARIEQLGAKRVHPRADCDVDWDARSGVTEGVFAALEPWETSAHDFNPIASADSQAPFPARLLVNRKLTRDGSKECGTRDFARGKWACVGGDALGVLPTNCPALVGGLLEVLGCDGEEAVAIDGGELPLRLALLQHFDITKPSTDLLNAAAAHGAEFAPLLDPERREELKKWLWGREVFDVIASLPKQFTAAEFIALLRSSSAAL